MLSDLRFALRQMTKSPAFTAVAVLALALAIGVNAGIFAVVNGVFLRTPVSRSRGEVAEIYTARRGAAREFRQFSHEEFQALRRSDTVFADVAAVTFALAGIGEGGGMRRSFAFLVSENYLPLFGAKPLRGRFFSADECRPGTNALVTVASYNLWQRLGASESFVGSTLRINGQALTVIGVLPKGFSNGNVLIAPEVWIPLGAFSLFADNATNPAVNDLAHRSNYTLNLVGLLASGLTRESAAPRLPTLSAALNSLHPEDNAVPRELILHAPTRFSISTAPEDEQGTGVFAFLLLAMAGSVLAIASLNLANMLLARGAARSREIAVRLALGATRARIVRQLLIEGLVLALAGGVLGLVLAVWANDALVQALAGLFNSMNFALVIDLGADFQVIAATFVICLLATVAFSVGPALRATRLDLVHDLKQQSGDTAAHSAMGRFFSLRHVLVMAQIALALMLLFAAGLFLRAALAAGGMDLGYRPEGALIAELDYSLTRQPEATSRAMLLRQLEAVRTLPGVAAAGLSTLQPLGNSTSTRQIMRAEAPRAAAPGEQEQSYSGVISSITPGYLEALGVRLLRGRDFTAAEAADPKSAAVCIIDDYMARSLFAGEDPVGRRVRFPTPPADGSPGELEVVGVVNDHVHDVFVTGGRRHIFRPLAQAYSPAVFLNVRFATDDPRRLAEQIPLVRRAIMESDAAAPLLYVTSFAEQIERNVGLWLIRVAAAAFAAFGAIALLLAVMGVYGVKAYNVARRTREIGVRMALGAEPRQVFALVLRQGALQVLVAVVAGSVLALGAGRALSSLLYRVSPADPLVLSASALVLGAAALLACYVPARRATRVNPMAALRDE